MINCLYTGCVCDSGSCNECSIEKSYWQKRRLEVCFEWRIFDADKPALEMDYVVFIDGALESTMLTWNGSSFIDDDGNTYNVKYWGYPPVPPYELRGES